MRHPAFRGRIGVARRDITPPVGIRHRNWGAQTHDVAEGVHRPLTATVLTLQGEGEPVVIIALDLGWWRTPEDEWALRGPVLEALRLPEANLMIALSHTHAGPTTHLGDADLPGGQLVAPYLERVARLLTLATEEALDAAEPGTLDFASGYGDLAVNRDAPDSESDRYVVGATRLHDAAKPLRIGRVCADDGRVRATVLHYPCHPTTLAWENRLLSPDYVGAARQPLETETGAPCLFLQGASGDLAPVRQYTGDPDIADRNGRRLGLQALATFLGMLPPETALSPEGVVESGAPLLVHGLRAAPASSDLEARLLNVDVPLKPMPTPEELENQIAEAIDASERERLIRRLQVRESVSEGFRLPVWLARAGDIAFVGIPGEMNERPISDLAIGDSLVLPMNVVNGWFGYLPEAEVYDRDQYSVRQTPFARGAAERVCASVSRLFEPVP